MQTLALLACLLTASSAIFFPHIKLPNRQQMMNVCIYSVNPARYQPKCFLCPSNTYPNVLRTCVNAASIPSNISFTQASCLEQNCAIGRGKRSVELTHLDNVLEHYDNQVIAESPQEEGEGHEHSQQDKPEVVGTEEFYASEDYADPDYEESDNEELGS